MLHRVYRFVMLALAGGIVFDAMSSCNSEFISSLTTSLTDSVTSAVESSLSTYINELLGTSA